jgi:hypothetical protein
MLGCHYIAGGFFRDVESDMAAQASRQQISAVWQIEPDTEGAACRIEHPVHDADGRLI